ncbi:MAG TPA: hypothetical protein DHW73_11305 [Pseudomonas sp.]|nr:hypothetical protein [Pseudomonas sp.]HCL41947.1 hypothetical protein [Pseudomonas sp.]|tara:strand:+ start:383 stop:871 length:489 start_codon:yes stop_codon:yes gene_type:complete
MTRTTRAFGFTSLLAAFTLSGCASIVSDSQYPVSIQSSPQGADFKVTNSHGTVIHQGTTPATVSLESGDGYFKKARYNLEFSKEGYQDQRLSMQGDLDGWYWGNILFGGLIGWFVVDPVTGAMYKLPERTSANLVQVPMAMQPTAAVQPGQPVVTAEAAPVE